MGDSTCPTCHDHVEVIAELKVLNVKVAANKEISDVKFASNEKDKQFAKEDMERRLEDMNQFRTENKHILTLRPIANTAYKNAKSIDEKKERLYKSGRPSSEIQPQIDALDQKQRAIYQAFNKRFYETIDAR
jgi:uncharacterized Zn finger protein (UPF0148 family)